MKCNVTVTYIVVKHKLQNAVNVTIHYDITAKGHFVVTHVAISTIQNNTMQNAIQYNTKCNTIRCKQHYNTMQNAIKYDAKCNTILCKMQYNTM